MGTDVGMVRPRAYTGTSKKKNEYREKVHFFSCNLFQKVKLPYTLD